MQSHQYNQRKTWTSQDRGNCTKITSSNFFFTNVFAEGNTTWQELTIFFFRVVTRFQTDVAKCAKNIPDFRRFELVIKRVTDDLFD